MTTFFLPLLSGSRTYGKKGIGIRGVRESDGGKRTVIETFLSEQRNHGIGKDDIYVNYISPSTQKKKKKNAKVVKVRLFHLPIKLKFKNKKIV